MPAYWERDTVILQGCCWRGEAIRWRSFQRVSEDPCGFSYRTRAPSLRLSFSECRKRPDGRRICGTGRFPLPPLLSWALCVQAVGLSSKGGHQAALTPLRSKWLSAGRGLASRSSFLFLGPPRLPRAPLCLVSEPQFPPLEIRGSWFWAEQPWRGKGKGEQGLCLL